MQSAGAEPCAVDSETFPAAVLLRCVVRARTAGDDPGSPHVGHSVISAAVFEFIFDVSERPLYVGYRRTSPVTNASTMESGYPFDH